MMSALLSGTIIMFVLLLLTFTLGDYLAVSIGEVLGYGYRVNSIAELLGLPGDTGTWPQVLWFVIVPTLGILAIIYGFLETFNMFRGAASATTSYVIIGVAMSGTMMYSGMTKILAQTFFTIGALMSVIVFMLVFIFGVFAWGAFRSRGLVTQFRGEYGPLRGAQNLIKKWILEAEGSHHALKKVGNVANLSPMGQTRYNDLKSTFYNAHAELTIKLREHLNQSQMKRLNDMKKDVDSMQ